MSRIANAFEKGKKLLIVYMTVGDPTVEKTIDFVMEAVKAGADLIELGIPFSDPVAEGPVIQRASERALAGKVTIQQIFAMVETIRTKTDVPLVFLTYFNPVFHYGIDKFTAQCAKFGVDGLIIPDVPFEENNEINPCCIKNGLDLISLIAPTSEDRVEKIAHGAKGFVYCVSSVGVTGMRSSFSENLQALTNSIKKYTDTPVAIGFGISNPEQVSKLKEYADGLIVGSAVVKLIEEHGVNADQPLYNFISSLKRATK